MLWFLCVYVRVSPSCLVNIHSRSPPFPAPLLFLINGALIMFQAPGLLLKQSHFQNPLQLKVAEVMLLHLPSFTEVSLQGHFVTGEDKCSGEEDRQRQGSVKMEMWNCLEPGGIWPALFGDLLNFYVVGEINPKLSYCRSSFSECYLKLEVFLTKAALNTVVNAIYWIK